MSNGFPELPDLETPPLFIDGPGGGPAMPTGGGGGKTAEEEEAWDEASDNANNFAVGTAGVAVVAGAVSSGAGGVLFGLMSAGFAALGLLFAELAEDPPQTHEQIVSFQPRLCRPPGLNDPILSPVGIAIQRSLFALVTARGLLDAMERSASAQQAGDLNWAITHHGVAIQCHQTSVVDVATLASAMYAAGQALSGSEFDLPLEPDSGGVREWIESPGMEAKISKQMHSAGFLNDEINAVIAWWKTDPKYSGPRTRFSSLSLSSATKLYASAQRLVR